MKVGKFSKTSYTFAMRIVVGLVVICFGFLISDRGLYVLSRLYEGAFFYTRYEYLHAKDPCYYSSLSYDKKVVCLTEEFSREMESILLDEEPTQFSLFSDRKNLKTFGVWIGGKQYIVKRHLQSGVFKNLLQMGKGVSIWNNLHWMRERGIQTVDPVAFSEKRTGSEVVTMVVYRFEGESIDHIPKEEVIDKLSNALRRLREQRVVHADLRSRNIVYTKGEDVVKFIDVDLMHFYPRYSYVCKKRLDKEEAWLEKDYR